jgi:glycosyltransferase involved in cell wall biosynthesis
VDVFLHALAATPEVDGLIVGGHPREADLGRVMALAESLGLGSRLTVTGLLPPHAVADALATADIFVLPNTATAISERYTSPLKLFEYLARGGAIIASDLPALREVVTHQETAWLVPAGDAPALAAALSLLASDRPLRERLGQAAHALSAQFTWEKRAERLDLAFTAAMTA